MLAYLVGQHQHLIMQSCQHRRLLHWLKPTVLFLLVNNLCMSGHTGAESLLGSQKFLAPVALRAPSHWRSVSVTFHCYWEASHTQVSHHPPHSNCSNINLSVGGVFSARLQNSLKMTWFNQLHSISFNLRKKLIHNIWVIMKIGFHPMSPMNAAKGAFLSKPSYVSYIRVQQQGLLYLSLRVWTLEICVIGLKPHKNLLPYSMNWVWLGDQILGVMQ